MTRKAWIKFLAILLAAIGISLTLSSPASATPTLHALDGNIHGWQYGNISVEDHTGSNYFTLAQVNYTRNNVGVPIYYIQGANTCAYYAMQGFPNCIKVYNANYGQTGWFGRTLTENFRSLTGEMVPITIIQFNDYYLDNGGYYDTAHARNVTECHEFGHAVGLWYHRDADQYQTSCMMGSAELSNLAYTGYNSADANYLYNWYH